MKTLLYSSLSFVFALSISYHLFACSEYKIHPAVTFTLRGNNVHPTNTSLHQRQNKAIDKNTANTLPEALAKNTLFQQTDNSVISNEKNSTTIGSTVIMVFSARENKEKRNAIRSSWFKDCGFCFFIIGDTSCDIPEASRYSYVCSEKNRPSDTHKKQHAHLTKQLILSLENELSTHNDIVFVEMVDVYRSLSEKLQLSYKYFVTRYAYIQWFVKVDDDTYVHPHKVKHYLSTQNKNLMFIAASFAKNSKVGRSGKWAEKVYKPSRYPPFPNGAGHVVSRDIAKYVSETQLIHYQGEDTSMGIWLSESALTPHYISTNKFEGHNGNCYDKNKIIIGHKINTDKMIKCYASFHKQKTINVFRGNGNYKLDFPNGLHSPLSWSQYGQDRYIDNLFKNKKNGFFVEIGAYDGEKFSNTLFLEKERDWDGLLIEANPHTYAILRDRDRKCTSINACVSNTLPTMTFIVSGSTTSAKETMTTRFRKRVEHDVATYGKSGDKRWQKSGEEVTIQCQSFGSMMKQLGRKHVDYFSLDVEGAEMVILESIPFEHITIGVFTIEVDQNKDKIDLFMKSKGYTLYKKLRGDYVYVNKKVLITENTHAFNKDLVSAAQTRDVVHWCGYPCTQKFTELVFSNYEIVKYDESKTTDLVVVGMFSGCNIKYAQGKILYVNGEGYASKVNVNDKNSYVIGAGATGPRSLNFTYGSLAAFVIGNDALQALKVRPKNTYERFLIYVSRKCRKFREDAFDLFSTIGTVYAGSQCHGTNAKYIQDETPINTRDWSSAYKIMKRYRFALVMDNKNTPYFITEKIINAITAGSVPIYWGPKNIFSIFNRKAFVFYNINNPKETLSEVLMLKNNFSAYMEMLNQPILANGDETLRKYFSLRTDIGNGILRNKIKKLIFNN